MVNLGLMDAENVSVWRAMKCVHLLHALFLDATIQLYNRGTAVHLAKVNKCRVTCFDFLVGKYQSSGTLMSAILYCLAYCRTAASWQIRNCLDLSVSINLKTPIMNGLTLRREYPWFHVNEVRVDLWSNTIAME